jgi:hypothetical protein
MLSQGGAGKAKPGQFGDGQTGATRVTATIRSPAGLSTRRIGELLRLQFQRPRLQEILWRGRFTIMGVDKESFAFHLNHYSLAAKRKYTPPPGFAGIP